MKRLLLVCMIGLSGSVAGSSYAAESAEPAGPAEPVGPAGSAGPVLPENGFKAEQEGRWEDAVVIYREALQSNPGQIDIWLRLAEIHSHLKQYDKTAEALEQASALRPDDAALWKKLSEARAMANQRTAAFAAVSRAVELAPANLDYLRAKAQLAVWADNNEAAAASYRKILSMDPNDAKAGLWLARISSWSGQTDTALQQYHAYLAQHADDKEAWLEMIKVEGWNGDFPSALEDLDRYHSLFGEDRGYLEQRARALAWLGKSSSALAITQHLLAETPGDVEVLTSDLVARSQGNQIDEALADLATIEGIQPDSKATRTLQRYLLTPLRSWIGLGASYSNDSDDLHLSRLTLDAEYVINPHARLFAGVEGQALDARVGSGLENINGSDDADYNRVWLGAKYRFSPMVAADIRLGGANADGDHQFTEYRAGLDLRLSDDWWLRPEVEQDLYAVSPRAVSLAIERESVSLLARWAPGARYVVDMSARQDTYSDGNERWEVTLAPRRAMWRTQSFNLDLGLSANWQGFDKNLNNGYYDPHRYERYAVTSFMYWKIDEDNGVSLALSLGGQKDETMSNFKIGGDAVVQGFFGITSDWYLRVYGSLMHNVLAASGAYRSNSIGFTLIRRF